MFDRLIDILVQLAKDVLPFVVIREYQEGVLLRLGKYRTTLNPGFHWIIPMVDSVDLIVTVWTTITLPAQSVSTRDSKLVVVKGMVKYRVSDSKTYTLDVFDAKDALSDTTCGIIFDAIHERDYSESNSPQFSEHITNMAKKEAKKWGITVRAVTLTDFSEVRSIRLFNESIPLA